MNSIITLDAEWYAVVRIIFGPSNWHEIEKADDTNSYSLTIQLVVISPVGIAFGPRV